MNTVFLDNQEQKILQRIREWKYINSEEVMKVSKDIRSKINFWMKLHDYWFNINNTTDLPEDVQEIMITNFWFVRELEDYLNKKKN
jgi:hypothetical protein